MSFSTDISDFVQKTGARADQVLRLVGFRGYVGLLLVSPVDTGRFRGSWRLGVNRIVFDAQPPQKSKAKKRSKVPTAEETARSGELLRARFGDTLHITNILPYAIELNRGHSKQAKARFLEATLQSVVMEFEAVVAEVRRQIP